MNAFSNDNGIEYDDNEIQDNDDTIEDNDSAHEENETQREGARFLKRKHGSTIDHTTAEATPVDTDLLPAVQLDESDEGTEAELPRNVADKLAKQQIKEKYKAAQADFGKPPKVPKEPSNDNFKPVVSWPLMDQLTRSTFEPDKKQRTKNIISARYIRELIDIVEADSLGLSVHLPGKGVPTDYDIQRTATGNVYFENGQTMDRRKVTISKGDDVRFIGSMRTAKKSLPMGNAGFNHDESFPVRLIAAREELAAIILSVGPLWPSLNAAISENATMTDIGVALGVKSSQASIVGTVFIKVALRAAIEALSRFNEVKDAPRMTTPLPVKSYGSFYNQSSGPVIRVAA
jgi:hypothetical protein